MGDDAATDAAPHAATDAAPHAATDAAPSFLDGGTLPAGEVHYEIPPLAEAPPEICLQLFNSDRFWYRTSDTSEWSTILRGERRDVATDGSTMDIARFDDGFASLSLGLPVQLFDCLAEATPPPSLRVPIQVEGAREEQSLLYRLRGSGFSARGGLSSSIHVVPDEPFQLLIFEGRDRRPVPEGRILFVETVASEGAILTYDLGAAPASSLETVPFAGLDGFAADEISWGWRLGEPFMYPVLGASTDYTALVPVLRRPKVYVAVRVEGTQRVGDVDLTVQAVRSLSTAELGDSINFGLTDLRAPELSLVAGADGSLTVSVSDASPAPGAGVFTRSNCVYLSQETTETSFGICDYQGAIQDVSVTDWVEMRADEPIAYRVMTNTSNRLREHFSLVEFLSAGFRPPAGDPNAIHSVRVTRQGVWEP